MITLEILERRRDYICSSDVAGIWGISPFTSPHEVWLSKVYKLLEYTNPAMESGNENERYIIADIGKHFGYDKYITNSEKLWKVSKEHPLFACNLDAVHPPMEAKLTSRDDEWGRDGTDTIPKHFYMQVQQQMLVTGCHAIYVGVWICKFGLEKRYYTIKRDEQLIAEIIELGTAWWNKYVVTARNAILDGKEPPCSPKQTQPCVDTYRRIIPRPKTIKAIGFEWYEYMDAKEKVKAAEKEMELLKSKVMEIKGDNEALEIPGGDYYMVRNGRLGVVKRDKVIE